jgi:phosphoribosyl-AMP cyclohydrolase
MTKYKFIEKRKSIKQVEESTNFVPKFNKDGLIPVVTTDHKSGEVLMQGFMNIHALNKSIEIGEAVYYSRSRKKIWHKGKTSGFIQTIKEMRIDDDQDCLWIRVKVKGGSSCHVGYRSCFYRAVPFGKSVKKNSKIDLKFKEINKVFDPRKVYKKSSNPTKL